jgi:hypothetical protein
MVVIEVASNCFVRVFVVDDNIMLVVIDSDAGRWEYICRYYYNRDNDGASWHRSACLVFLLTQTSNFVLLLFSWDRKSHNKRVSRALLADARAKRFLILPPNPIPKCVMERNIIG